MGFNNFVSICAKCSLLQCFCLSEITCQSFLSFFLSFLLMKYILPSFTKSTKKNMKCFTFGSTFSHSVMYFFFSRNIRHQVFRAANVKGDFMQTQKYLYENIVPLKAIRAGIESEPV